MDGVNIFIQQDKNIMVYFKMIRFKDMVGIIFYQEQNIKVIGVVA